ncbi:MAG: hypothetical protein K0B87_04330 [Candidatus Syntrophosphaera sp.]|nr:hypothetical protein [Candidatus Syntrophosphaera sp.]
MSGCIQKKNPTGNNWSDVRPLTYTDDSSFYAGFSFPGSGSVLGSEPYLLCGNYGGTEVVSFMRFTALPAEGDFYIPGGYQDSTYLELSLLKRSPLDEGSIDLQVYKLDQSWAADSTSLILDANLTQITLEAFPVPDTVSTQGTIVKIPIPPAELENWRSPSDTLGITLAVKTSAGSYVEIDAAESGKGPRLVFKYRNNDDAADAADSEYQQRTTRDSYRIVGDAAPLLADSWVISNTMPSRIYLNFVMDYDNFRGMPEDEGELGPVLSEEQRKRATINLAELVFYVKESHYYSASTPYQLRGDKVRDSLDISVPVVIEDAQLATGLTTLAVLRADSVVVNITPLIQAYSSGDSAPWGVVVRSMQELRNFGWLELWHFTDAPADKKPKLRVTYTPPFL